ncbi:GGDEF domain-containing protein [Vibrio viridaestus]|uniref:diguanylate cyclase n=1 Tax=Vibrio viridaestus TaxID=2487322 RepID=A0A3N9TCU8_9VIBR|nr:GGDEF domain-containing protein [Vibrio viridaestus]RQW61870.1 GGDEF domain-containing protein [Vibrio viridaestus]
MSFSSIENLPLKEKKNSLIIKSIGFGRVCNILALLFSACIVSGYIFSIPDLYRPFHDGPATNPLTALCLILLSLFSVLRQINSKLKYHLLPYLVIGLVIFKLIWHTDYSWLSEWLLTDEAKLHVAEHNAMGLNTSIMLLLLAVAKIFQQTNHSYYYQSTLLLSLVAPSLALTGYVYHSDSLYGSMSLSTMIGGYLLCVGAMASSANKAIFRLWLKDSIVGKIARLQIIVGVSFCFILGFICRHELQQGSISAVFPAYVAVVCWLVLFLTAFSSHILNKSERQKKQYEQELIYSARLDPLTGILNRRGFQEELNKERSRQRRYGGVISVLMIDIDYFKRVNDTFGHDVGDEIIKTVATIAKTSVRCTDIVCRYGGEEIIVALPKTSLSQATLVAYKIKNAIAQQDMSVFTGKPHHQTVSIGCAAIKQDTASIDVVFKNADLALYQAKRNGRNRVVSEIEVEGENTSKE